MSLRRTLATLLLLPLFVFLERGAWYGYRAVGFLFQVGGEYEGGLGLDAAEVAADRMWEQLLIPIVLLLAGALGLAVGPWSLLLLGSLLALPALVLLGLPMPAIAGVAITLLIVGHATSMSGVMSSAAAAFRGRAEHLRTVAIALVYVAINLGGVMGPVSSGALSRQFGFQATFIVLAAPLALAVLVAALLGGAMLWTRAEVAAKPEPAPPTGRLLLGSFGLMVLVAVPWLCSLQSYELIYTSVDLYGLPYFLQDHWFEINPVMCVVTGVLVAIIAAVMHLTRLRLPTLFAVAVGLLLLALAQVLILVAALPTSPWLAIAGLALSAVAEATLMVFLTSRMLGDLHWRLVALVGAVWLSVTYGLSSLLAWLGSTLELAWWAQAVGWAGVGSGLLVALILAVVATAARKQLWTATGAA